MHLQNSWNPSGLRAPLTVALSLAAAFVLSVLSGGQPVGAQANADDLPEFSPVSLPVGFFADAHGLESADVIVTRIATVEWVDASACELPSAGDCGDFSLLFSEGDRFVIVWVQGGGAVASYLTTLAGGLAYSLRVPGGPIPPSFALLEETFLLPGGLPMTGTGGLAAQDHGAGLRPVAAATSAATATLVLVWLLHRKGPRAANPLRRSQG